MKFLYLFFIFLPVHVFSQSLIWTDTMVVNSNAAFGYARPRIVLTNDNVPVISWGKSINQGVYVSRLNGSAFGPTVKVTPNGINAFVEDWAGPELGASGDTVFVAFKAQPENAGMVYVVRSLNGGNTFSDTLRVSNLNWSRFPAVAVAPGGNPVVTFMKFDSNFTNPRYTVSTSADGGATFNSDVEASVLAPGEVCDCCPSFIGTEQNNVYLLFRNNDNNLRDIWTTVSTNGGSSFSLGADIDNTNWIIGGCPSTGPDGIINNDSLTAVWMSGASGSSRVYLGVMDRNSLAIGQNSLLTPNASSMANQNYPRIAGNGDTLGIVWQESQMGSTITKFIYSLTGPAGLINKPADTLSVNFSGAQKNPDIAYADGTFHFAWQDNNKQAVIYRTATISESSGINYYSPVKPVKVYPNPSNEKLYVELNKDVYLESSRIILSDYTGKTIFYKEGNLNREVISTGNLSEGFYILTVTGQNISHREKIIVVRE